MFLDALLPNLVVFAAGQAAAFGWLRTGFMARGVLVMVLIWCLADWALLARFVFDDAPGTSALALALMQLVCIAESAWFLVVRARRRFGATRPRREELFAGALAHYLQGETGPCGKILRRLVRFDPWDLSSRVLLALAEAAAGRHARARRMLRRAKALDVERRLSDLIEEKLEQWPARERPAPAGSTGGAGPVRRASR